MIPHFQPTLMNHQIFLYHQIVRVVHFPKAVYALLVATQIFENDGRVIVLYERWAHKNQITKIDLCGDSESRPSNDLIAIHNSLARSRAQGCCPDCWKFVGMYNIDAHQKSSCESIDFKSDAQDGNAASDSEYGVNDASRQEHSFSSADCDNADEHKLMSTLNIT
ncbi:hypothetical protein MP228_004406 [Amoeboaphelidium protococcarum]|nr:hypothetical protein MP228_004406 [Amoeboaphelidium protococcarum]